MIDAARIVPIAEALLSYFSKREEEGAEYSIFLCGGARNIQGSIRDKTRLAIEGLRSKYSYRVYYPEDLFSELLAGHERDSLLSLENILARSVSCVGLIVESPGSLVELGAFSNHDELSKKLVVVIDEKYRASRSFINLGPVRHLKSTSSSRVYYYSLIPGNVQEISYQICEAARQISAKHPPIRDLGNPLASRRFFLALIYVADPLPRDVLLQVSEVLAEKSSKVVDVAKTVMNTLIRDGLVTQTSSGLSTTPRAEDFLMPTSQSLKTSNDLRKFLHSCRVSALTAALRK